MLLGMAVGVLLPACQARAGALAAPTGKVILEITGQIGEGNAPGLARFDRAMLEALGPVELRTATAWTEGEHVYRGVPLRALLDHVGAVGDRLHAVALNEYEVIIPLDDPAAAAALLAFEQDGQPMRIKDKGPLWIVFPWSEQPSLDNERVRNWAVWQLKRLEVTGS
jgi:hypothetical protein